jgi:hypothetical protein
MELPHGVAFVISLQNGGGVVVPVMPCIQHDFHRHSLILLSKCDEKTKLEHLFVFAV